MSVRRLALPVLALFALGAAPATAPPSPASPPAASGPAGKGLYTLSAVGLLVGTTLLAGAAGTAWPRARFDAVGRPDPLIYGGGLAIGLALDVALTWLLLPQLTALGDRPEAGGSTDAARAGLVRFGRWPAGVALLGVVTWVVGALLEGQRFGRGSPLLIAGGGLFLSGLLTFDVLAPVGTWGAYRDSRGPRAP